MAEVKERIYYDKFVSEVSSNAFTQIRSYDIPQNSAYYFEIHLVMKSPSNQAVFKRSALFNRDNGSVEIVNETWNSDKSLKSNVNIDIDYQINYGSVDILAKNSDLTMSNWTGKVLLMVAK
jgi:hypothetical protein